MSAPPPEFSRPVRIDTLGARPRAMEIAATAEERAALAARFGFVALDALSATLELTRDGEEVRARGNVQASLAQSCAATGAPVPENVDQPFDLLFRPAPAGGAPDEEIELDAGDLDILFYESARVDVGEAVAETLSLAVNPYPRAGDADERLRAAGVLTEEQAGPFAALGALRDRLGK